MVACNLQEMKAEIALLPTKHHRVSGLDVFFFFFLSLLFAEMDTMNDSEVQEELEPCVLHGTKNKGDGVDRAQTNLIRCAAAAKEPLFTGTKTNCIETASPDIRR